MTNQQAIATIKVAISEVEWDYPMEYAVAFEKAIEALEKQIPKKVIREDVEVAELDYCPNCKVSFFKSGTAYCGACGQALDWSGNK